MFGGGKPSTKAVWLSWGVCDKGMDPQILAPSYCAVGLCCFLDPIKTGEKGKLCQVEQLPSCIARLSCSGGALPQQCFHKMPYRFLFCFVF